MNIQGSDVLIQALVGDDYLSVACARSVNLRTGASLKETTTKGDGRYEAWDYDKLSAAMTIEGLLRIQEDGSITIFDFMEWQNQFMETQMRILFRIPSSNLVKVFRGTGIIEDVNCNGSAAQVADGTVQIKISGQYFLEDAIPEYINVTFRADGFVGSEGIFKIRLIDALGNVIFTTEDFDQVVLGGWLQSPYEIVKRVQKGDWKVYMEYEVNSDNNILTVTENTIPDNTVFGTGSGNLTTETYSFIVDSEIVIGMGEPVPPPPCIDVVIPARAPMPDAQEGTPYSYSFPITGTSPFTISNVTKPEWMNIGVAGNIVTLSGTPVGFGTGIEVSFDITNCASGIAHFTDEIDVAELIDPILLTYALQTVSEFAILRIFVNGSQVAELSGSFSASEMPLNPGDVVTARLSGLSFTSKTLLVTKDEVTELYNSTSTLTREFTFTVEEGSNYYVEGQV